MNANYTPEPRKPAHVSNNLYTHLRQCQGWVGTDLDSETKFALTVAKQFGITVEEAQAAMVQVWSTPKGA